MPDLPVTTGKQLAINKDPQALDRTIKVLQETTAQLAFFINTLSTGKASTEDVKTHMSLLESGIRNVSRELELDCIRQAEDDLLTRIIRQQSKQIQDFSTQIGDVLTAEQFSHAIRYYETKFEEWYNSIGFEYAALSINQYCLEADFSPEMHPDDATNFPPELKLTNKPYRQELIDCEHNRTVIQNVFKNAFPSVRIREYDSRITDNRVDYGLRICVLIPYEDLQNL